MATNTKPKMAVRLTESAIMIALATILSLLKLVDLPRGGSITLASMLPVLLIAYRYGTAWGMLTGFVHGVIQLILDPSVLSPVTGALSVASVIILDYSLAFAVIGLGGLFRKFIKKQNTALLAGSIFTGILRYICHVIVGCTVWAGLSIPTAGALIYSFIYNATYMIPETLVLAFAAYYIGSVIDFSGGRLTTLKKEAASTSMRIPHLVSGALICAAGIFDVVAVFATLQNAETGEFDITGIVDANWIAIAAVTGAAIILSIAFCAIWRTAVVKKVEN
ncbi:MAG: energy-coupled thiamine transporter ThiT [Clostridiales bacterium]|nr:energy-coupled thiamine transporter ThiT [Clostridiales bacterium]